MLPAIQFDHQLAGRAGEVGDVLSDRVLAAELSRQIVIPQGTPEAPFRLSAIAAKLACSHGSRPKGHRGVSPHLTPALSAPEGAERELVAYPYGHRRKNG